MSEPDIIIDANIPGTTLQKWIWIESPSFSRQGSRICPGTSDKWRISIPLKASLAQDGELILDEHGQEIPTPCPLPLIDADLADYAHHPEVMQLFASMRDTLLRIVNGTLEPIKPVPQDA